MVGVVHRRLRLRGRRPSQRDADAEPTEDEREKTPFVHTVLYGATSAPRHVGVTGDAIADEERRYHYKYESGREGGACLAGFSSRKGAIKYLMGDFSGRRELRAKLGNRMIAKARLSIRRLSDVNPKVLEQLVAGSVAQL